MVPADGFAEVSQHEGIERNKGPMLARLLSRPV